MMKKKNIVAISAFLLIIVIGVILFFIFIEKENKLTYVSTKEATEIEVHEIKSRYNNLLFQEFEISIENVEVLYNFEIKSNTSYLDRTFIENFEIMDKVIDDFFVEDFDKSYIVADFDFQDEEDVIYIKYNDIRDKCTSERYNLPEPTFLFGNNVSNDGYMVQIDESLRHIWFSKGGFGSIQPSMSELKKVHYYLSGKRQVEDVEINLRDGKIKLSKMEEKVLEYLNNSFPTEVTPNVTFAIGDARVLSNGDYEGICFQIRRVYKGIPFEYGSSFSSGMYVDDIDSDGGQVSYTESSLPDTMLGFGNVNGTIIETETITEMISLDTALELLSTRIGENSLYDIYGIELVYRECEIPEERIDKLDAILKPKWKIITINQNDDKYTVFYVDVVTGEISERFEYYYE